MLSYICFEYGQLSVVQLRRFFNEHILHFFVLLFDIYNIYFFRMAKTVPNGLHNRRDH